MKVGLFIPCYIDQLYPHVGIATLELLEKLGVEVVYPPEQTCCGQPMANSGCEHKGVRCYQKFVAAFHSFDYIVSPSSSCVYQIRHHYDILEQTEAVKKVRSSVYELCEFLVDILRLRQVQLNFPYKVGLHQSCHGLRGLKLGKASELHEKNHSKTRQLLESTCGLELISLEREDECCGFGGTFSIFEPDVSAKMGTDRIMDHQANGVEFITATDMSCLMHLEGLIRRQNRPLKVLHIAEILNTIQL